MTTSQKELVDRRSELTRKLVDLAREMSEVEDQLKSIAKPAEGEIRRDFDSRSSRALGEEIEKLAAKVLKDVEQISTGMLLRYMTVYAPKFKMPGKDPAKNLSAHLSNSSRFKSTKKGWVLVPKASQS